jgi:hypothetical protein
VERVNDKGTGIKVAGERCNVSIYHALAQMPKIGQRVTLNVQRADRGVWIQSIDVLDDDQVHELPRQARSNVGSGRSPAGSRDIRRLSVLKAAAGLAAGRPDLRSVDVLAIAGRWLAWVEEPEVERR